MPTEPSARRLRDPFLKHPGWTVLGTLAGVASAIIPFLMANGSPNDRTAPPQPGPAASASAAPSPSGVAGVVLSPSAAPPATPSATTGPSALASPIVAVPSRTGPPPATPSPSPSPVGNGGVLQAAEGTWIDWDAGTPTVQGATGDTPTPMDVRIGPDNAYPENSARLWRTDSPGSCAAQAASNGGTGFQTEFDLHTALQPQAGSTISACLVTTGRRVAVLTISSAGDNTFAPYRIQYRFS
ncbi:hypothetical protein [Hamadaea tsunoensis]|uniref:hypothetical protein n=1 Tax=Hamadaea tsunoensis TaxID=53368 RepID=UPI00041FB9F4|nr:hypothetical protein [Hamadaea tsunoensis]